MSCDPIKKSLSAFVTSLGTRLELGVHTTEDAVRYTFFANLLAQLECGPERLVLEFPHPNIPRALIDAWIMPAAEEPACALEFKFHRRPAEARNRPRTMLAGSILSDLFKLARIGAGGKVRRVFVYVYGREMHTYYSNIANGMAALIDMPRSGFMLSPAFMAGKSPTFTSAAGTVQECRLAPLLSTEVHGTFRLRAFEVFRA